MGESRWLMPVGDTDVPGVAVFGDRFETVIDRLQAGIAGLAAGVDHPVRLGVPPVISRALLERVGYVESFPHLLGTIHAIDGDEAHWSTVVDRFRAGEPWARHYAPTDLVALPAACYHLYPRLTGQRLIAPLVVDITGHCYRHERSAEPGRLRSFRMRELIRVDRAAATLTWRDDWVQRARDWLASWDLPVRVERASDPFFGAADRLIGAMQRAEHLKWELVVPVGPQVDQAVISCNYHKDHFSVLFDIAMAGEAAHSACVAFGLERIAMAVLHHHGTDPANWPP